MDEYGQRLIAALVSESQALRERLRPADREQLDVLLDLMAEGGDERRLKGITQAVAAHLRASLGEEERGALGRRFSDPDLGRQAPHDLLLRHVSLGRAEDAPDEPRAAAAEPGATGPDRTPEPDPAPAVRWASARDRILAEPSLTAGELRDEFGVDVGEADLIRLRTRHRAEVLPAFQFDSEGRPRPLVLTINGILGAATDPWGVADWWLGPNMWLDAAPAELLGAGLDDQLLAAASVVGEDD